MQLIASLLSRAKSHSTILGVATSNRVGNLIGARSALGAKYTSHAATLLSVIIGAIVMIILLATKDVGQMLSHALLQFKQSLPTDQRLSRQQ